MAFWNEDSHSVDDKTNQTHTFTTTVPNEHKLNQAHHHLHGKEKHTFTDPGYRGAQNCKGFIQTEVDWNIAKHPSKVSKLIGHLRIKKVAIKIKDLNANMLAFVEHPSRSNTCQFGFQKACYKVLAIGDHKLVIMFDFANIYRLNQLIKILKYFHQNNRIQA